MNYFRLFFQFFSARPHHRAVARNGQQKRDGGDEMKSEWRVTCNYIGGRTVLWCIQAAGAAKRLTTAAIENALTTGSCVRSSA